jgi:hypothetical protein
VIVAVNLVRMVQMALHEVIDVAAVRHALVAAFAAVLVPGLMPAATVIGCAARRFPRGQLVLVDVVSVHVMQVTVV